MQILFVADPLSSFKIYKDTTFVMMREAQRRGHQVLAWWRPRFSAGAACAFDG
jgi:glutathione synthase/RimK-type ligase-like ATP-grasp enzyme